MIEPKLARHMWWVLGCVSLYLGPTKNQRSGLWYCGVYPIIPGVVAPSMHASLAPTTVYSLFTSYSLHATELFYYISLLLLLAKHCCSSLAMWWVLGCVSLYLGPKKPTEWHVVLSCIPCKPQCGGPLDARKLSTYHCL